jgi:hypothetical protein
VHLPANHSHPEAGVGMMGSMVSQWERWEGYFWFPVKHFWKIEYREIPVPNDPNSNRQLHGKISERASDVTAI